MRRVRRRTGHRQQHQAPERPRGEVRDDHRHVPHRLRCGVSRSGQEEKGSGRPQKDARESPKARRRYHACGRQQLQRRPLVAASEELHPGGPGRTRRGDEENSAVRRGRRSCNLPGDNPVVRPQFHRAHEGICGPDRFAVCQGDLRPREPHAPRQNVQQRAVFPVRDRYPRRPDRHVACEGCPAGGRPGGSY